MLDKPAPAVEETNEDIAERWVRAFDAALRARSEQALSECFADDSHWRNLFGISWYFATFSGRATLVRELLVRSRDVAATNFRIDTALLVPRRSVVAGREVIEAVIRFDTANGPGFGAVRLLPSPDGGVQAWTISTTLDFDRICAARDWRARRRPRTSATLRKPTGSNAAASAPPIATAILTCSWSAAATPAFPPPSKSSASACPRWSSIARNGSATIGGCAIAA